MKNRLTVTLMGLLLLGILICAGCYVSPPPPSSPPPRTVAPPPPPPRFNTNLLVGTWRGVMSVPAPGAPNYNARLKPLVELEIFGPGLRGRLTRFFVDNTTRAVPFFGRMENGRLVSRWKDGRWMELDIRGVAPRGHMSGTHNFVPAGGTINLDKIR